MKGNPQDPQGSPGESPQYPGYPGYGGYGGYGYPGSPPSRWPRFFQFLKRMWSVPLLAVAVAAVGAAFYIDLQPPLFVSNARMWVSGKLRIPEGSLYSEELQFFFGTQVELLQTEKIQQTAVSQVAAANPTLVPSEVKVQITQAPKSSMFILRATGEDPAYTQAYLDALIDAYLNYKKQVRSASSEDTIKSLTEEVSNHAKALNVEQEKLANYQRDNNLAVLQDQSTAAGSYLQKLNTQLSDLKLDSAFLEALAIDTSTNAASTNLYSNPSSGGFSSSSMSLPAELTVARQQLQLLKVQREELSSFLRPKHPKMIRLDEDIARAEKLMVLYRQQTRDQIEPARQSYHLKIDAINEQIKEWEGRLRESSHRIGEFERLKANVQRIQSLDDHLSSLLQTVDVNKTLDQEVVSVMEKASPPVPTRPSMPRTVGMASAGGLFAGLAFIFLVAKFDDRINSMSELMEQFDENIVGQVPDIGRGRKGRIALLEPDDDRHMFGESYRNIRSSVLFMPSDGVRPKLLLITSAVPSEGKSTVSANLARTMAFAGGRVLLVDGDMRRGRLHDHFGIDRGPGLAKLLQDSGAIDDYVVTTSLPNLFLIPCGEPITDSSERFLSGAFEKLLKEAHNKFDHILFDSAPVFAADDAPTMAPRMDGVLFVVRGSFTRARMAREALAILYQRQAKVLGLVFNRANPTVSSYYYYKYTDYYAPKKKSKRKHSDRPGSEEKS